MEYNAYMNKGVLYFKTEKIPTKKIVLRRMGVVPNTFAGNMIERLYDYYFANAVNFKKEYKKFYSKEFDSIVQFIAEHYNINEKEASLLADKYSMKECSCKSIDRSIELLNLDENFKDSFSISVGGIKYENSDGIYYE